MKCIAVDDEPLALALLQDNISQVRTLELVATCSTAMEALGVLNKQEVDLIFLDIQMPGKSGIELVQEMNRDNIQVVFVGRCLFLTRPRSAGVIHQLVVPVRALPVPLLVDMRCNPLQTFGF